MIQNSYLVPTNVAKLVKYKRLNEFKELVVLIDNDTANQDKGSSGYKC